MTVDIDRGTDPSDNVDTQAWIFENIPNQGQAYLVTSKNDASALDQGSDSDLDPNLPFTADHSGNYYVAITAIGNDWAGQSGWSNTGSDAGDYTLNLSLIG